MSYTRRYSEVVSKTVYVSYSYPASQSGGSGSKAVTVDIPVDVNIHVDTDPFDRSIDNCNRNVNLLTGAVVATEAAQIVSIDQNAKKIAGTIIEGFFKTVRSEISQQIMKLSNLIDTHLVKLHDLAKSCVDKQKQMETDYHETSNRYMKIFDNYNKELENRIFELNKPAFSFKNSIDRNDSRMTGNDRVTAVSLFGAEGGALQTKISASIAKKRALDTINQVNVFLWKQKMLDATIKRSMLNENTTATRFAPVCFIETCNDKSQLGKNIYQSDFLPAINPNVLIEKFRDQHWTVTTKEQKDRLKRYFNAEVNQAYSTNVPHDNRIKEMIVKIFDVNSIKSNNN